MNLIKGKWDINSNGSVDGLVVATVNSLGSATLGAATITSGTFNPTTNEITFLVTVAGKARAYVGHLAFQNTVVGQPGGLFLAGYYVEFGSPAQSQFPWFATI